MSLITNFLPSGKDDASKAVKKLSKEILKLFSKRFSVDVAEGGKIKKHHKSEFIFSEVVSKFQVSKLAKYF